MRHACILSTGSYVPNRVVTNAEAKVGTRRDALNPGVWFFQNVRSWVSASQHLRARVRLRSTHGQHRIAADVAPLALRNAAERDRWALLEHF